MLTSISGRSVIVTGASKGIGKGIARVFAQQGAKVMVVARTLADAEATAAELGDGASGFSADVADWEQSQAMAAAAVERHGGLALQDTDPDLRVYFVGGEEPSLADHHAAAREGPGIRCQHGPGRRRDSAGLGPVAVLQDHQTAAKDSHHHHHQDDDLGGRNLGQLRGR